LAVIGSFRQSDADTGELVLRLKRSDAFLFRTGPKPARQRLEVIGHPSLAVAAPLSEHWTKVELSDARLPEQFDLRISDSGTDWGEWFAVALRRSDR
jgi:hypothetical protein